MDKSKISNPSIPNNHNLLITLKIYRECIIIIIISTNITAIKV